MKTGIATILGLIILAPFLFGQGCEPPSPETSTERAHRICEPLYEPGYVDSMIRVSHEDMEIRGVSYTAERYSAYDACDRGCAEHNPGAYVECVQTCYPCMDLVVDIGYDIVAAKEINDPVSPHDLQLSEWVQEEMRSIESEELIE